MTNKWNGFCYKYTYVCLRAQISLGFWNCKSLFLGVQTFQSESTEFTYIVCSCASISKHEGKETQTNTTVSFHFDFRIHWECIKSAMSAKVHPQVSKVLWSRMMTLLSCEKRLSELQVNRKVSYCTGHAKTNSWPQFTYTYAWKCVRNSSMSHRVMNKG